MKKLFLVVAFIFASSNLVNANSNEGELLFGDCTQAAWDWGTRMGGGTDEGEYYFTNSYFEVLCNDDGSFR